MTRTAQQFHERSINPDAYLVGETPIEAKTRILGHIKTIVERGLKTDRGVLQLNMPAYELATQGGRADLIAVQTSVDALNNEDDLNYMQHSNDPELNAAGTFLNAWNASQMLPEKGLPKDKARELRAIEIALDKLNQFGRYTPRRWDTCHTHGSLGVPAQKSLAGKGMGIRL